MPENIGHVIQIAGPAVDVQFSESALPPIYSALRVTSEGFNVPHPLDVILEVEQQLGEGRVRCVAMEATDGMVRGMKAIDQGGPISAPVGRGTLGRVMNVIGEPVDNLGPIAYTKRMPIHRLAPAFDEQSTTAEISPAFIALTHAASTMRTPDSAEEADMAEVSRRAPSTTRTLFMTLSCGCYGICRVLKLRAEILCPSLRGVCCSSFD